MSMDATTSAEGASSLAVDLGVPFKELQRRWTDHLEREYIGQLLGQTKRNVSAVAERAGLDRTYVHRLIKKHGL
ncbi:hypothetical protein BH09MYX1_BH09MYX1_61010 [soil metagenome]